MGFLSLEAWILSQLQTPGLAATTAELTLLPSCEHLRSDSLMALNVNADGVNCGREVLARSRRILQSAISLRLDADRTLRRIPLRKSEHRYEV